MKIAETCVPNEFFSSVFTKESDDGPALKGEKILTDDELKSVEFTSEKVIQKINNLRPHAAPGPDKITGKLLQLTKLTAIFNVSL